MASIEAVKLGDHCEFPVPHMEGELQDIELAGASQ